MTGITSSEYLVLRVLYANNKLQPCEIASILRKDKAAICRTLKALERKELIYTESVSRKCVKVNISEKGLDIKNEIMKVAQERQKALESVISENEINLLTEILDKIIIENKIQYLSQYMKGNTINNIYY